MNQALRPAVSAGAPEQVTAFAVEGRATPSYQGLVTRGIAFALDAALINLTAIIVAAGVALALSVLQIPDSLDPLLRALGGTAYVLWSLGYFVIFWSSTGETPGNRVMRIRVCVADSGKPPTLSRALLRFAALILAVIPLFAGVLPILVDARRRGLQDMLAGTVVVAAPQGTPASAERDVRGR